jgi:trimeric autotransporter adhesin
MLTTLRCVFCGFVLAMLVACGGGGGGGSASGPDPVPPGVQPGVQLVSISVGPQDLQVAKGLRHALEATGIYSDSTKRDLSAQVVWSASDAAIASVDANGVVSTLGVGSTVIAATLGEITGNAVLQVTGASLLSIDVSPAQAVLTQGAQQNLTATGVFSDNSVDDLTLSVTWAVSDSSVAAVSAQGALRALAPGLATVSASLNGVVASSRLTVNTAALLAIDVTPDAPYISSGTQVAVVATGLYSDNSRRDLSGMVTWTSSEPSVANVMGSLARGTKPGMATLTATLGQVSGSTALTVTAATLVALQVEPSQAKIAKGTQQAFTATGVFSDNTTQDLTAVAVWRSQDSSIASVGNAGDESGLAQGLKVGAASLQASVGGVSGAASLEVTAAELVAIEIDPISPRLAKGTYISMQAIGLFSDNTTQDVTEQVAWRTSNSAVAVISNADSTVGRLEALQEGSATITAGLGSVLQTTSVQVTAATLVLLEISPDTLQLAKGTRHTFGATGVYSDNTTQDLSEQVTWSTSDALVAAISNDRDAFGLLTTLQQGQVEIVARLPNGTTSAPSTVSVTSAQLLSIGVSSADLEFTSVPKGTRSRFVAMGVYTDNSLQDLTKSVLWRSDDPGVLTVSNDDSADMKGWVRGVGLGSTALSASLGGVVGTATVTVSDAKLVSMRVFSDATENDSRRLPKGLNQRFSVVGVYSDQSEKPFIDQHVFWYTTDPSVAYVRQGNFNGGVLHTSSPGRVVVSAVAQEFSYSLEIEVTEVVLRSLTLTASSPTVDKGGQQQITATGLFSDGTVRNLTEQVLWKSAQPLSLAVSNNEASRGLVTWGGVPGNVQVSASIGSVSASIDLVVKAAVLVSIEVSPIESSRPVGTIATLVATGIYSDNTTRDITRLASWSSSMDSIASVRSGVEGAGNVKAFSAGNAQIRAHLQNVTGSTQVTVVPAIITSEIRFNPSDDIGPISKPVGTHMAITAQVSYSDNIKRDITAQATWSSSQTDIASVSKDSAGQVTIQAKSPGVTLITAKLDNTSRTMPIVVSPTLPVSLEVRPTTAVILSKDTTQAFTAVATYNDGSAHNVSMQVFWEVGDTSIASITPTKIAQLPGGVLSALTAGATTVGARFQNITSPPKAVTVSAADLQSITLSPVNSIVNALYYPGTQYRATGNYSDGRTQNITQDVTWLSDRDNVIAVSNKARSKGWATVKISTLFCGNYNLSVEAQMGNIFASVPARVVGDLSGCE